MEKTLASVAGKYYKEKKGVSVFWDKEDLKNYADVRHAQNLSGRPVSEKQFNLTLLIDDFDKQETEKNKDVKSIVLHYSKSKNKVFASAR